MKYRCEATSVTGFIQQLAVGYVRHGYFFYVVGQVPEGKDPRVSGVNYSSLRVASPINVTELVDVVVA